jgi:Mobilization protein NikA
MMVRLSDQERDALRGKAGHLTLPEFARKALFGAPAIRPIRRVHPDMAGLAKLSGELGKVGSNLNQIARVLNASGRDRPALLDACLHDLQNVLTALQTVLGVRSE